MSEEETFLETAISLYSKLFKTKEEMFLVGYLMALGSERYLLNLIEQDLQLLNKDCQFFMPIVVDKMRIYRKDHAGSVKKAEKLLVKFLKSRGAEIPAWLKKEAKAVERRF